MTNTILRLLAVLLSASPDGSCETAAQTAVELASVAGQGSYDADDLYQGALFVCEEGFEPGADAYWPSAAELGR